MLLLFVVSIVVVVGCVVVCVFVVVAVVVVVVDFVGCEYCYDRDGIDHQRIYVVYIVFVLQ